MFMTVRRILALCVAVVVALVGATSAWLYISTYHPNAIEVESIVISAEAPLLQSGQSLKVLNWNIQFLAGNRDNYFFFDGGTDPWPSLETVTDVTRRVADVIRAENPDVILLQELDEGAARTHYQDQLQELLALLPADYRSHVSSFYWKADFVPHPEIMGAIGMKMSIISKYKIENARRYALAEISNQNIVDRQFNAKRAVLAVEMPIAGGGKINVLNTHLSAFAQHTDTMDRQVAQVNDLLSGFARANEPTLVGGDFNLVPSMEAYRRLSDRNKEYYNAVETELAPLLARFNAVPSLQEADGPNHNRWYTHMANHNHSKRADKTIDYIFYTDGLSLGEHHVQRKDTEIISDHLPIMASFTVLRPEQ